MEIFEKLEEIIWKIFNTISDIFAVFGVDIGHKETESETEPEA